MARFRPLLMPGLGLLISLWLIYDHWINPDPMWRYPKAEAAGPLFFLIFAPWLLYATYRVLRPLELGVGMRVMFMNGNEAVVGLIADIRGDVCTVRTEAGSFEVNRHAIDSVVWGPSVGESVKVRAADGALYPAVVRQIQSDQVHVQQSDGRELWVPMSKVAKG
jgi:hypothetical protein